MIQEKDKTFFKIQYLNNNIRFILKIRGIYYKK